MNRYRVVYQCSDGYKDEVIVYAVNRLMAFEAFKNLGYENVVNADVYRVIDEEDE